MIRTIRDFKPGQVKMFRTLNHTYKSGFKGVSLYSKPGSGKTGSTLMFIKANLQALQPVLIVAPKSVAEIVWTDELKEWEETCNLKAVVLTGKTETQRISLLSEKADIFIVNYSLFSWLKDNCDIEFNCIVYDEISAFKSHQTKVSKIAFELAKNKNFKIGLTGTPTGNSLLGVWSQTTAITSKKLNPLGKNITAFKSRYFMSYGPETWQIKLKEGATEQVLKDLKSAKIAFSFDSVKPCKVEYLSLPVKLPLHLKADYDQLIKDYYLFLDENRSELVDVASAAVLSNKLRQFESGAVYYYPLKKEHDLNTREQKQYKILHEEKIKKTLELLTGLNGRSLIIFYAFIHERERLENALNEFYKVETKPTPNVIKAWNNREVDVLLFHPASASKGLNLQFGGHNMLFFSAPWSVELWEQAIGRLPRHGQTNTVNVYTFSGMPVEEKVITQLKNHQAVDRQFFHSLRVEMAPPEFASKKGTRVKSNSQNPSIVSID